MRASLPVSYSANRLSPFPRPFSPSLALPTSRSAHLSPFAAVPAEWRTSNPSTVGSRTGSGRGALQ